MENWRKAMSLAGLTLVAACAGERPTEGVVARTGDYDFSVEQAVALLVDQESLPNDVELVRALADLWVDYTLLAAEVATDTSLGSLNLEAMVRQQLDQETIFQLRDSVIQVDTTICSRPTSGKLRTPSCARATSCWDSPSKPPRPSVTRCGPRS
jgi:hypothetical protein